MNRELLEQPFPANKIKQRRGRGRTLDYVEAAEVIKRLNDAFDGKWSFRIVSQERFDKEVVVTGELEAEGCVKQQFGSKEIAFKSGTTDPLSLADTYKSAASDAIKKCATLFGVALHLYGVEDAAGEQGRSQPPESPPAQPKGRKEPNTPPPNGKRVQSKDEIAVWAIAKKLGLDKFIVCKFNDLECDTDGNWKTAITAEMWKKTRAMFKTLEDDVKWLVAELQIEPELTFEEVVVMIHTTMSWNAFDLAVAKAKQTKELNPLWTMVTNYRKQEEMPENGEM